MAYNKSPISLKEGKAFIDGVECMDGLKINIKFTPTVWTGSHLGEKSKSSRWMGYSITGEITQRRSTAWLKDAIKKYISSGATPEFTIQGIMNDTNSDYYPDSTSTK